VLAVLPQQAISNTKKLIFVMGFGVREPTSGEHVPGTSLLYGAETDSENHLNQIRLKHSKGKDSNVILVPQPSDSPNDPLVSDQNLTLTKAGKLIVTSRIGHSGRRI
jgi:hypothetical protein